MKRRQQLLHTCERRAVRVRIQGAIRTARAQPGLSTQPERVERPQQRRRSNADGRSRRSNR
jgi:hypothetical protein